MSRGSAAISSSKRSELDVSGVFTASGDSDIGKEKFDGAGDAVPELEKPSMADISSGVTRKQRD